MKSKLQRFQDGMKALSPAQLAHAKMIGYIGTTVGVILAIATMLFNTIWYFTVFLFFIGWLQIVEGIKAYKEWQGLKDLAHSEVTSQIDEKLKELMGGEEQKKFIEEDT